ncbi:hypothetical protein HOE04_01120 [archaeon]|jgi:hypothetical protein|nr:hypothetical protein [archaeon]
MEYELFDWFVTTINYLIFVYIFIKTLMTPCFNTTDLTITLIGIIASVLLLITKTINKK